MSCFFGGCFSKRMAEWQLKETNYIHQLKLLQANMSELVQQLNSLDDYHKHEKSIWQEEKSSLLERINTLQNDLHQKEIVTKQYQIYQDSFQQERFQIQELFETLHKLEEKNEAYEKQIAKMGEDIVSYRNAIHRLVGEKDEKRKEVDDGDLARVHKVEIVGPV